MNQADQAEKLNYEAYAKLATRYSFDELQETEKRVFARWLPSEKIKILDLGCGAGRTTINLWRAGHQVCGADINPAMIAAAKARHPELDFRLMDACALQFSDESFDMVLFSYNGLDYIYPRQRRRRALAEIRRVLAAGGLFIMSSHNSVVWPSNRYGFFFWFLNIVTGKIFTPYRLEYKQYRQGIKFVHHAARPAKVIAEMRAVGFERLDIFANARKDFLDPLLAGTKNLFLLALFSPWPYFVFRKK